MKISVTEPQDRLDAFLAESFPDVSRSEWQRRISKGLITINGRPATHKRQPLAKSDSVNIDTEDTSHTPFIHIPILYEDGSILVINKPPGLLSQKRSDNDSEPVVTTFVHDKISTDTPRGGLVHRLDRDTSGVMVLAKSTAAAKDLHDQFKQRTVAKIYRAVVEGQVADDTAEFQWPIGRNPKQPATYTVAPSGKSAITRMRCLDRTDASSRLELELLTGRTHQLRVHLAHYGHPIVGDPLYGTHQSSQRLMLHSHRLTLRLVDTAETRTFTAELPEGF